MYKLIKLTLEQKAFLKELKGKKKREAYKIYFIVENSLKAIKTNDIEVDLSEKPKEFYVVINANNLDAITQAHCVLLGYNFNSECNFMCYNIAPDNLKLLIATIEIPKGFKEVTTEQFLTYIGKPELISEIKK